MGQSAACSPKRNRESLIVIGCRPNPDQPIIPAPKPAVSTRKLESIKSTVGGKSGIQLLADRDGNRRIPAIEEGSPQDPRRDPSQITPQIWGATGERRRS